MKITVETIPHHDQRYDTCGDWIMNTETQAIDIKVSEMDNWRYEFLVAFHELIEVMLCVDRGITTEMVDKFDMAFESMRSLDSLAEPGDDPDSPYRKEHFFATSLERLMAAELHVDWFKYEDKINALE